MNDVRFAKVYVQIVRLHIHKYVELGLVMGRRNILT
jgi:hypothetical protein